MMLNVSVLLVMVWSCPALESSFKVCFGQLFGLVPCVRGLWPLQPFGLSLFFTKL